MKSWTSLLTSVRNREFTTKSVWEWLERKLSATESSISWCHEEYTVTFNICGKQKPLNSVKLLLVQMGNVVNALWVYPETSAGQRLGARLPWRFSIAPLLQYTSAHLLNSSKPQPLLPPFCSLSWMTGGRNLISADLHQGSLPIWNGHAAHPLPVGHGTGASGAMYVWIKMRKGMQALGYNGHRDMRGKREWGGVMDFLAKEPTGGAGIGCPGLKRETGDWLPQ